MSELSFKTGRPRKWKTVKALQTEIDKYFNGCDKHIMTYKNDEPITEPYTIEGLCEVLECDRKTLLNYEKEDGYSEFFHTIKKAKNKIQKQKLTNGMVGIGNPAVTIFDLKNNHGYRDKQPDEQEEKTVYINFKE